MMGDMSMRFKKVWVSKVVRIDGRRLNMKWHRQLCADFGAKIAGSVVGGGLNGMSCDSYMSSAPFAW